MVGEKETTEEPPRLPQKKIKVLLHVRPQSAGSRTGDALRKPDLPVPQDAHPTDISHPSFLISTLCFESLKEQLSLLRSEKRCILGESGYDEKGQNGNADAKKPFEDEDPA